MSFPIYWATNNALLAEHSTFGVGSFIDLSTDGNTLYTTDSATNTFRIYNVSNIASPTLTSSTSTGANTNPMGIRVNGNYLYICYRNATNQGLAVWNITNPASPSYVTTLTLTRPVRVILNDAKTYAYVINGTEPGGGGDGVNMYVVDISTASAPSLTGTYTGAAGRYPSGLVESPASNHIFLAVNNALTGLLVISIGTPSNPVSVGEVSTAPNFSPGGISCDGTGDWVYLVSTDAVVTNHFVTINCTSKAAPSVGNYLTLVGTGTWLEDMQRYGSTLYVTHGGDIHTINASSPSTPELLQTITSTIMNDVAVATSQSIAFACDSTSVLHVLTIT